MNATANCPVCEEGVLTPVTFQQTVSYEGRDVVVHGLEGHRCSVCDAEPMFPAQIRRNQSKIADAKRDAAGFLSSSQIRAIREGLGLSQQDAAVLFGGGPNGFSKYERGQTVQSVPMDRLLRIAGAYPWIVDFLRGHLGLHQERNDDYVADIRTVSLGDPHYTSRPVRGRLVVASPQKCESKVVSITEGLRRKVA